MAELLNDTIVEDLKSLADDDDPDFFRDTVKSFSENAQEIIGQIETLASGNDGKQTIRRLLHQLKGSSYNIGAQQLGDVCDAYESNVKDSAYTVDYHAMLKELRTLLQQSQAALKAA